MPLSNPAPSGAIDPTTMPLNRPLPSNLKAGDTIERGNKVWAQEAPHALKEASVTTILVVGAFLPGPEDAVVGVLLEKYGYKIITVAGKRVLGKAVGKGVVQVTEAEAKAFLQEYRIKKISQHGHPHFKGMSSEQLEKMVRETVENFDNFHQAKNGKIMYKKGNRIVIINPGAPGEGTVFIPDNPSQYAKNFMRDNP